MRRTDKYSEHSSIIRVQLQSLTDIAIDLIFSVSVVDLEQVNVCLVNAYIFTKSKCEFWKFPTI